MTAPDEPIHVLFASYGNDSIALIQWAHERGLKGLTVVHSDTGWAADHWIERVQAGADWARSLGFTATALHSEGMIPLVTRKKGWPLPQKYKFCTEHLKINPAKEWLAANDPDGDSICMVGVRRCESRARATWPTWVEESDKHGGRSLWSPLALMLDDERDALVARTPFPLLPHRSQECFPCINANRNDLRRLTPERVEEIAALEARMGFTSNDKPRTMFRPYRHQGATGIREVWKWAQSKHGEYGKRQLVILGEGTGCDSGMCGEG